MLKPMNSIIIDEDIEKSYIKFYKRDLGSLNLYKTLYMIFIGLYVMKST
jgi:hypothetical protein